MIPVSVSVIRRGCMRVIRKHGVLNSREVCRLVNNNVNDPSLCYFDQKKEWGGVQWNVCASNVLLCKIEYERVRKMLQRLVMRRWIRSKRMRWTDNRTIEGKKVVSLDTFTFYYIRQKAFEKKFGADLLRWCK